MAEDKEQKVVFKKRYQCPVCDKSFNSLKYMTTRVKLERKEIDLRFVYSDIVTEKYEPIVCTHCGYAALEQYFGKIVEREKNLIKDTISSKFKGMDDEISLYSYKDAILRYSFVMANALAKKAKFSESAYICLKNAWLYRGIREKNAGAECGMKEEELLEKEITFLGKAISGFCSALEKESFPMCGMTEETINYLLAALAYEVEDYKLASDMIGRIFNSRTSSQRVKDKARDLKELIKEKNSENNESI